MKTFVVPIFLTWCSVSLGFTSLRPHEFRIAHPSAGNIYPGVGDLIAPPYLAFPTLTTHIGGSKMQFSLGLYVRTSFSGGITRSCYSFLIFAIVYCSSAFTGMCHCVA